MRGSYLNDPCRELRSGEPDDEPKTTEPSLAAQDRAEDLLVEFVADHPPTTCVIALARELERWAAEALDAAKVYAAPPWLSDVAEALGLIRPEDGAPLALNWTQALKEIRDQRESLAEVKLDLQRLMGDERIESVIMERDSGRTKISGLLDAAERLLEHFSDGLPDHLIEEFRDAVDSAKRP